MRLQKQLSRKGKGKDYHKYVLVLSEGLVKEAGFKEGDELQADAKSGEVKLRKK